MGKNSKQQAAEQAREYRLKREQEEAAKQKQQNKLIMWILIGILGVAIVAAGIGILITQLSKPSGGSGKGDPVLDPTNANYLITAGVTEYVKLTVNYTDKNNVYRQGEIIVKLNKDAAPITVDNFQMLVAQNFYNGLTFHRVYSGFMIQGGAPDGNGSGGSSQTIKGEFSSNGVNNPLSHKRGVISMARSQSPNSASSQFFIMHEDNTGLDGDYAAFGEVVSGMDTVDGIAGTAVGYDARGEKSKPVDPPVIVSAVFVTPKA